MYLLSWGYFDSQREIVQHLHPKWCGSGYPLPPPTPQADANAAAVCANCVLTSHKKPKPKPFTWSYVHTVLVNFNFHFHSHFAKNILLIKIKIHSSLLLSVTVNDIKWKASSNLLTFLFFTAPASLLPLCSPSHSLVPHRTGQVWIIITWNLYWSICSRCTPSRFLTSFTMTKAAHCNSDILLPGPHQTLHSPLSVMVLYRHRWPAAELEKEPNSPSPTNPSNPLLH